MTAGERPAYSIVQADPRRDLAEILALWQGNFGPDAAHEEKILHLYANGPAGPALVMLLRDDTHGEPAGIIGAIPRPMRYAGAPIPAAVISHVVVAPRHRTLGPVLKLHAVLTDAGKKMFDVGYGYPNPKNATILKRTRYHHFGQIKRYVKALRYGQYTRRVLPAALAGVASPLVDALGIGSQWHRQTLSRGITLRWSTEPGPEIDQVWAQSETGRGIETIRSSGFLRWRFAPCIASGVRYLLASSPDTTLGWFACEDNTATPGRLNVLDYRLSSMSVKHKARCIHALLAQAHAEGYASVELALSGNAYQDEGWHAAGFVERSAGPITGYASEALARDLRPEDTHMTYLDNDA